MPTPLLNVTVIIPAPPGMTEVRSLSAVNELDFPVDRLEILLARGRQPSVQRNAAVREGQGEILYFLDDDSVPSAHVLDRALSHFSDPRVALVGGPNLCPKSATWIQKCFAATMAAPMAFGPSRARYWPLGEARETSEKELILCNMLMRRSAFLECGGFNERLYPNEENALLDSLQQKGYRLVYDPEVQVERLPRRTLKAFIRMLFVYGRGRAEQFRTLPTLNSALNFVPVVFCIYLVILPLLFLWIDTLALFPMIAYLVLALLQVAMLWSGHRLAAVGSIPFTLLTHICYGVGFMKGLFTAFQPPGLDRSPVTLERIRTLNLHDSTR